MSRLCKSIEKIPVQPSHEACAGAYSGDSLETSDGAGHSHLERAGRRADPGMSCESIVFGTPNQKVLSKKVMPACESPLLSVSEWYALVPRYSHYSGLLAHDPTDPLSNMRHRFPPRIVVAAVVVDIFTVVPSRPLRPEGTGSC